MLVSNASLISPCVNAAKKVWRRSSANAHEASGSGDGEDSRVEILWPSDPLSCKMYGRQILQRLLIERLSE